MELPPHRSCRSSIWALLVLLSMLLLSASGATISTDDMMTTTTEEKEEQPTLPLPASTFTPPGGGRDGPPLGRDTGVIRLRPSSSMVLEEAEHKNATQCLARLNRTCFGLCLGMLRVNQLGPVHNLTSMATNPLSPYIPHFRTNTTKTPCTCPHGYGIYFAHNHSAFWYFPGQHTGSPARILNVTTSTDTDTENGKSKSVLIVRHLSQMGTRGKHVNCPFVYEIASGVVMGLKGANGGQGHEGAVFPVWATVLLAMGGVLVLSAIAFFIIKGRGGGRTSTHTHTPSSAGNKKVRVGVTTAVGGAGGGAGRGKREKKKHMHVRVAGESLGDPLLDLEEEEEGKVGGGGGQR